jgi:hypothetical protein
MRGMMRGGAAFLLGLTLAMCAIILVQSMLLPGTDREHADQGSAAVLELRR